MRWPWSRRHKPEEAPAVKEAQEKRDELFDELDVAMHEVDRVQKRVIDAYARADRQRIARKHP